MTHPRFTHTTKEIAEQFKISETTLRRMRQAGYFRPGKHYIATGVGLKRPNLLWALEPVEELFMVRTRRMA